MTSKHSLTKQTIKRLRLLAKGNGVALESIQLIENKEETYTIPAFLQLSSRSSHRTKEKLGHIKSKNKKVLPSFSALIEEVSRIEKEAREGEKWIQPALEELERTPGHGWGHQDSHLSWSDKETILVATENCPSCKGEGHILCNDCQGRGSTPCHFCHGSGLEPCKYCNGTGRDPTNPQNPCTVCHGTCQDTCYMCHGKKIISCRVCGSKGHTKCKSCKGTGAISREVRLRSGADMSFSFKNTSGLPSGLLRAISRIGGENLHRGHADIQLLPPDPEARSLSEKSRLILKARIPYADLKVRIGKKGAIISCFGKRAKLSGVPAFLDESLKPSRKILATALKSQIKLEKALGPRCMKDALNLCLSGKNHPNHLRRIYPVALTGNCATEIMSNMAMALKRETMKVRTIVAVVNTLFYLSLFAGIFFTPLYAWGHSNYKTHFMITAEIITPLLAVGLTWLTLHGIAKMVLKLRFPSTQVNATPDIGGRGYMAMSVIFLGYAAMLIFAKMHIG